MSRYYTISEFEDILIYFSSSIMTKDSEESIAWDVAENCISKLDFVDCVIYYLNEKENILIQVAAFGPKNPVEHEILEPITIKVGHGITGYVAKCRKAEIVEDTSKDPRYIIDDEIRLSEIAVPIAWGDELYGVIDSEHPEKGFFNEQHMKILSAIASICAIRIKSIRAEREIQQKNNMLLKTQIELLDLKVKALRSQMNPHFVFNAMDAIRHFITVNDQEKSMGFLSTFSKLIRYHLNYFEKDAVPLEAEIDMLSWYLSLQKLRYSGRFEYQLNHLLDSPDLGRNIPCRVLPSMIENAVERSDIRDLDHTELTLYFTTTDQRLKVEVYCSQALEPSTNRIINYREQIMPWEEQVDLLNRLKNLNIERSVTILNNGVDRKGEINISVSIPFID